MDILQNAESLNPAKISLHEYVTFILSRIKKIIAAIQIIILQNILHHCSFFYFDITMNDFAYPLLNMWSHCQKLIRVENR